LSADFFKGSAKTLNTQKDNIFSEMSQGAGGPRCPLALPCRRP